MEGSDVRNEEIPPWPQQIEDRKRFLFAYKITLSTATCAAQGECIDSVGGDLQTTDSKWPLRDDTHRPQ